MVAQTLRRFRLLAAIGLLVPFVASAIATRLLIVDLPSPEHLYERAAAPSTRIFDRHGRLLYEIIDPHRGAHTPVPLADIPRWCVDATVATEDASFYANSGVDLLAIARALWINLRGGQILSGGSTITQQLARNLLLSADERAEVSIQRKLRETLLAWRLARAYGKDEILTLYLNETYYGNLAYGIEAAAQTYFAKSAAELDLAECALLAGLPQSPASYNPLESPRAARSRQGVVLGLMVKHGYLPEPDAELARRERLYFASTPFPIEAPHFVMTVRGQLERVFGLDAIYTQGLQVYTTLDLDAQNAIREIVRQRMAQLVDTPEGVPRNVHNAAVVAIDPRTGEVLAMVGSPDYFDVRIDGAVNAAVALRQPGSAVKPITYAAAFDPTQPGSLTAATMMVDVRTAFPTQEGAPYVPRNYDRRWRGPVLLREALACSYNVVAVKVLDHVGVERMAALARGMGITSFDDVDRWGLSLTLGGAEVSLLELTAAYSALANGGYRVEPVTMIRVENSRGQVLRTWQGTPGRQVLDERVAYLITDILSDNLARAPAFGEGSVLQLSRPSAAKTGTTTDWRDNWAVGYTPELAVGVWTGNADNAPMGRVSGVTGAAPIWHDTMETLLKGRPVRHFAEPAGMVRADVCADSGLPPSQMASSVDPGATGWQITRCPRTITELFIQGTEPTQPDDWHWLATLDTRNGMLAGPDCPPEFVAQQHYTLYPAEASDWARWQDIPRPPESYSPLCPAQRTERAGEQAALAAAGANDSRTLTSQGLVFTSPDTGARYRLSLEIPVLAQRLVVAVRPTGSAAIRRVTLLVDGQPLTTMWHAPYQTWWPMMAGTHRFTAVGIDQQGQTINAGSVTVEVVQ